ncbi:MAG: glycine--tRNA ligase subunit beta [Alphaproteobacteria bacterium]|nr:glycine--tRNA ligase subunit beta [Alphaproteobacteria bacterium]
MAQFLLEILTEEIPSSLQVQAQEDIKNLFINELNKLEINFEAIAVFSTPRRLSVFIDGLPQTSADKFEEKKGPRVDASSEAIAGFLKTYSLKIEDCEKRITPKGEFYFYQQVNRGGQLSNIIVDVILNVLLGMKFKKSMVWNESKIAWARPIRSLLAFFNENILQFSFAGVDSANKTAGHHFIGNAEIEVKSIENYFTELENNYVILDSQKRQEIILNAVAEVSKTHNVNYIENENLLQEIVYLVEYPSIYVAEIPQKYMNLPKELLVEIIVKNQRYINFINRDDSLSNKYVIVSNLAASDGGKTIINGNNKVLQARLDDGLFFYNNDLKTTLKEKSQKLKNINFFEGLGSLDDKTLRVVNLFRQVFGENQDALCEIYKADLVSETVVEIPELQGIMGYYYALNEGIDKDTALAIKNQYKPQGAGDNLPENILGAKLALLDKLDTLIGFFSIGKKPSGSKDPFALRRAAIGIIRIIEGFAMDIDFSPFVSKELNIFLNERLEVYLGSSCSINAIKQALASSAAKDSSFNINKIIAAAKQIDSLLKSPAGLQVMALQKRITNILKSQKQAEVEMNESLLQDKLEQNLYQLFKSVNLTDSLSHNIEELAKLKKPLDLFLDAIQINMSESIEIKNNRIKLLALIENLCLQVFE